MMENAEIAKILREIGEYLEMQDVQFKPRAYEKVAEAISSLETRASDIYKAHGLKGLQDIPGVGKSIAEHIEELLKTGKLKYYNQLKKKTPVDLSTLSRVEGLGPKKIKTLYKRLNIKTLKDLERAAKKGKIGTLEGFGKKSEENILAGINFVKAGGGRFLLGDVMPEVQSLKEHLSKLKEVAQIEIAGSIRRKKETVGDVDILVVSRHPKEVMDTFVSFKDVVRVIAHGPTKSSVKLKSGINVDLRVVPRKSFGAALQYFTGSKDHNVAVRTVAMKYGYKLNEYGLFQSAERRGKGRGTARKAEKRVAGRTEQEIYKKLGMDYIEPEMRTNTGEISLAQKKKLPRLIDYENLKGDLQIQTTWTDGSNTIYEMARAAEKAGLEYIAITDHTKRLAMTGGLDEKKLMRQMKEIDTVNARLKKEKRRIAVLKGSECDILKDGSLDLPDRALAQLDVVGISIHSHFNLSQKEQTARVIRAMSNPHADIFFHPTARRIQKRKPIDLDMDRVIEHAKRTGTILEIDAHPERLDLKDEYIRKCVEKDVKMSIDSDAHSTDGFSVLSYGIAQARRGWAEKKNIINAWPLKEMLRFLKNNRHT